MGLSKSRTVTLVVAIATLTSNILSSLLFHQLPDDPYHLAGNFGWYLHFANILSVFGFIGALRQHALSVAIFSNYLLLDTLLSSIPRFLVLTLIQPLSTSLCSPSSQYPYSNVQQPSSLSASISSLPVEGGIADSFASQIEGITKEWTPEGCLRIVWLAQVTLAAGLVAATLLQLVGALWVREYAKILWLREMRDDGRAMAAEYLESEIEEARGRERERERF